MYTHVVRCCVLITEKACTKFGLRAAQKLDVGKCTAAVCGTGHVLLKHSYCTDGSDGVAWKKFSIPQEMAEEKLARLLEDPEKCKLKKLLELEIDVLRHGGKKAPANISARHWVILLNLATKSQRRRQLEFMWYNEIKGAKDKQKEKERIDYNRGKVEVGAMTYGLQNNSLFMRFYTKTMQRFYNSRVLPAMMFGPHLVLDLGYEDYMSYRESTNAARQLAITITENRMHQTPFDLYLCNVNESGPIVDQLYRLMPTLFDDDFPINITTQSYLDIFPRKKLVYLTPHCNHNMKEFDSDKVYIVGAIVDKTNPEAYSLAKAKKEGLRMEKFPLDSFLRWGPGSGKSLAINICTNILQDCYLYEDWKLALRHVPRRKLMRPPREWREEDGEVSDDDSRETISAVERKFRKRFRKNTNRS